MAFVTGLLLIDASASALNNSGEPIPGARTENTSSVKFIRTRSGDYPYVSAQAFRAWLRDTLERGDFGWQASPIHREEKVAYTDGSPSLYWDDDLFGYMRAESKRASAKKKREADISRSEATPTDEVITRIAPFRVSTLVSVAPVYITTDFGVMARQEDNPVPYEHQFYRATLQGLFSLDLKRAGTFTYRKKTGYLNLDGTRKKRAKEQGLEHLESEKAYRLPLNERLQRVKVLFEGLSQLEGGAKLTTHYTDVSPALTVLAVTKGGNHIFGHVVKGNSRWLPEFNVEALRETLTIFADDVLSPVYVGWVQGYLDDERAKFEAALSDETQLQSFANRIELSHPQEAFRSLVAALDEYPQWLT